MKEEVELAAAKFRQAFNALQDGCRRVEDDLDRDGVIQRFEFTFEVFWKALRILLQDKGMDCKTPKDALKTAFRTGLLSDEEIFLNMLDDRNKTSHIYNKEESAKIFGRIKETYLPALADMLNKLLGSYQ